HCALSIEKALNRDGVVGKKISYEKARGQITFDQEKVRKDELIQAIDNLAHYKVVAVEEVDQNNSSDSQKHLVIIGGGSAAFAAAIRANELGARVTMINGGDLPVGGTCVNVGCVPSKTLIRAAEVLHKANHNPFSGIYTEGKLIDFKEVIHQKRELVGELQKEKYINVIKDMNNFEYIDGWARFLDEFTVEVNGRKIKGDYFLIATGAKPIIPDIPSLSEVDYLTNISAFELEQVPEKLIVLGGNYIGLEIAQIFNRFGSNVTVVEIMPHILPSEDTGVVREIQHHLEKEGIQFVTHAETSRLEKTEDGIRLFIRKKDEEFILEGSHVLVATGRKANTEGMGLEDIGIK
ncbi:MAG: mercury(II) reductase, partial [Methanobacteriota archaeon]